MRTFAPQTFHKRMTMEQILKVKVPATREEVLRRLEVNRRRKRELIERIKEEMRAEIKQRTGEDVTSFEVW